MHVERASNYKKFQRLFQRLWIQETKYLDLISLNIVNFDKLASVSSAESSG